MRLLVTDISKKIMFQHESLSILNGVNMECESGQMVVITGNSGSGKSTLLNVLSMLDESSGGEYYIGDKNVFALSEKEKILYRAKHMGIVFQQFNLINDMTCYDNVKIPLFLERTLPVGQRDQRIREKLSIVGMEHRMKHYPKTLSGGEQQRVAIARAIIHEPEIVFADEPTGNVDEENELMIMKLFRKIADENKIVVIVTHSEKVKQFADKVYHMVDGRLEE